MFVEVGAPHHTLQFHVDHQDEVRVFASDPVELLGDGLPRRQRRLVEAWTELHQGESKAEGRALQEQRSLKPLLSSRWSDPMRPAIHRVTGVRIVGDYTLEVEFADGSKQNSDFRPVMAGEMYAPLLDRSLFKEVTVDAEVHTLVWPNGADFDPAILHDWPIYEEAFRERAKQWGAVSQGNPSS